MQLKYYFTHWNATKVQQTIEKKLNLLNIYLNTTTIQLKTVHSATQTLLKLNKPLRITKHAT